MTRTRNDKLRRSERYRERKEAPRVALELFRVPAHVRRALVAMCPEPATPEGGEDEAQTAGHDLTHREGVKSWLADTGSEPPTPEGIWIERAKAARAAPGEREARRREYREEIEAWRAQHGRDATPSHRYQIARRIVERTRIRSRRERFAAEIIDAIAWARSTLTQEDAARDAQALRNELKKLGTTLGRAGRALGQTAEITTKGATAIRKAAAYLRVGEDPDAQLSPDADDAIIKSGADPLACGDALAAFIAAPSRTTHENARALVASLHEATERARTSAPPRTSARQLRHGVAVELAVWVLRIARDYGMQDFPSWYHDSTKDGEQVSAPVALVALAGEWADSTGKGQRGRRNLRAWAEITTEAKGLLGLK